MTKSKSLLFVALASLLGGCLTAPSMRQKMEDAIFDRDFGRMGKLFQDGFPIDSALNNDMQSTLLHLAVCFEDEEMIRYLLNKGASLFVHDKYGDRPIDHAYRQSLTNICELLAVKTQCPEVLIDGIPEPVLEAVFKFHPSLKRKTIFQFNRNTPSPILTSWLQKKGVRFLSAGDFVSARNEHTGKDEWRDKNTGEVVSLCEVRLQKQGESKYEWIVLIWLDPESVKFDTTAMCYEMKKEYGYWLDGK